MKKTMVMMSFFFLFTSCSHEEVPNPAAPAKGLTIERKVSDKPMTPRQVNDVKKTQTPTETKIDNPHREEINQNLAFYCMKNRSMNEKKCAGFTKKVLETCEQRLKPGSKKLLACVKAALKKGHR